MSNTKTFPLHLTPDQHATLKRRAKAKDMSMHAYAVSILTNGKAGRKPK